ncbi:MAG: acyl-CoA dehydrogenase [Gammaproteobacteria bacterium]|nr:MAG: acyl-CoA dehydrogenase [Gammaproteobacteria bacterium]
MAEYQAPVKDMLFVLKELAGLNEINKLPGFEEATEDLAEAVLEEAGQFAAGVVAPVNRIGDAEGTRVEDGGVRVPGAFAEAYRQFVDNGWGSLAQPPEFGGQGLPHLLGLAVEEMWQSASLAWSLCPLLTQGAVRAIDAHADAALKSRYLPKMVSGEWTGTMNLTEPQAGSDLSAVRTQAEPDGDAWRITGQKIFITWGDHDMTENVIHLVLARLPDAPPGVKGISLFLVPKRLVGDDGSLGEPNRVHPVSVEHKLGIHGSPTCVMAFEGALGYLVGPPHRGLACMFTMMNHARLGVGLEGVAIAERAYQQAVAYARERVQGKVAGIEGRAAIVHHPDVRRMLMSMKSQIEAMRALAYVCAAHLDFAHASPDPDQRAHHQARVDLLIPVVKGWSTETGQLLTSLAIQVHGGMGYIEETGVAQHFRDARITTIYEGTTGIQANDLVGRKTLRDGGQAFRKLLDDMRATAAQLAAAGGELAGLSPPLAQAIDALSGSLDWILAEAASDPRLAGAASWHLLMQTGITAGGWQLARAAQAAARALADGAADADFCRAKIHTARYYLLQHLPEAAAHGRALTGGSQAVMEQPEELL